MSPSGRAQTSSTGTCSARSSSATQTVLRCTASANSSSTSMDPALNRTRLRGFRYSRAEVISASSGLDQSRARSITCGPTAWRSSSGRCAARVRAARERACTSATPTAACSNSSRTPEAGSPSTSGRQRTTQLPRPLSPESRSAGSFRQRSVWECCFGRKAVVRTRPLLCMDLKTQSTRSSPDLVTQSDRCCCP
jgi:hypothetical protein